MTQTWNALAALGALFCATLAGFNWNPKPLAPSLPQATSAIAQFPSTTLPDGEPGLTDASGHVVPLRRFERIASVSTVADGLLLEFVERDRIVSFTAYTIQQGWHRHRYAGTPAISSINDIESIIALRPDLVLASLHGAEQPVARLREAGIFVFNLGEMRGVPRFLANVRAIATLAQRPELGDEYTGAFSGRLETIAQGVPKNERKSVAYAALFGQKLYGSGRNTNYADVFHYAGLIDKGSELYEDFPEYSAAQLLELNPELIVGRENTREAICNYPGLETLQPCADPQHRILELPEAIISSAGAEMLIAAELLHEFAYGPAPGSRLRAPGKD